MTKVQLRFRLAHPLDPATLAKLAQANALYGIQRVTVTADDALTVEYDATRLRAPDVEATLAAAGISTVTRPS